LRFIDGRVEIGAQAAAFIFEKDLGKNTAAIGARLSAFDPGAGWAEVAVQ
jgi:hypothetical protein